MTFAEARRLIDKHELWRCKDADSYNVAADHLAREMAGEAADDWSDWAGGYRPVRAEQQVEVRLHNGEQYKDIAGEIRWSTRNERDVARYRVVPA
ncbi:hypothetical protein [Sinorhizobium medicae]